MDNGSEDSTKEIAKLGKCEVMEEPNVNISRLRNLGVKRASGDILAFLDADCLVAPTWITTCLKNFKNDRIAAVGTRVKPNFNNATWVEKYWYKLMAGADRANFVDWLGTSNLFIRKKVFRDIGGFDETLETGEDVDLCYKIGMKNLICLEKSIDTIHLREPKTLTELFKKEWWRGKDSLKSLAKNNFNRKECLSVFVPAFNLLALIFLLLFGTMQSYLTPIIVVVILGLPFLLMVRKKIKMFFPIEILRIYLVSFVYIFARTCSLACEVYYMLSRKSTLWKTGIGKYYKL